MQEAENRGTPTAENVGAETAKPQADDVATVRQQQHDRQETRRWWIKLFVQPALLLACGATLIIGLGIAQKLGFVSAGNGGGGGGGHNHAKSGDTSTRYICPMMCTPPLTEPGRCPVCAMELVAATSGGGQTDSQSIQIDPAARRVANIRTVAVKSMPMTRTIRAIGELNYDEGSLKTISAYVDGRLERLYADYTGVVIEKGDHLALVYSPRLYSGQVELLLAKKAHEERRPTTSSFIVRSDRELYESARQRLIELGMTELQLEQLERAGKANSRMHLSAPISGTVIEKLAVEGEYVKEGQAIYKLADLSTVWLLLKMFPEDAAAIREGQKVNAFVQSLPGRKFTGRVAFISPNVDPKTRTVSVRVVIPNRDGLLRVGDYAKATIDVPLSGSAARIGFTSESGDNDEALVVPRDAVLMVGSSNVLYVETEPGRFEIRRVVLGPICGELIVVLSGVSDGEYVATRGNFLIDSQMQLAGNPSLIDPTRVKPRTDEGMSSQMIAALAKLSPEDRALAKQQGICPVAKHRLGSMGTPIKVVVKGTPVFICCEGCRESLLEEPAKYINRLPNRGAADGPRDDAQQWNLPPIGDVNLYEPQIGLPAIEVPQEIIKRPTNSQPPPSRPIKRLTKRPTEGVR